MLSEARITELIEPYLTLDGLQTQVPDGLSAKLVSYLDLLVKWNAKTNLSAIRKPEEMVERHFGESLFAGLCLRRLIRCNAEVLDLGSGAGFPGVPIALLYPDLRVSLAESQGKKAAFLREVVRCLGLSCVVWGGRAESMPAELAFDAVTLRAVDQMGAMLEVGRTKLKPGGFLVELTGKSVDERLQFPMPRRKDSFVRITPAL